VNRCRRKKYYQGQILSTFRGIGPRSGAGVQISIRRAGDAKAEKLVQFGDNNCNLGNFTAVMQANRVIFAHVNTPLFGFVMKNGGSGIDIIPALTKDPIEILKAFNPPNNYMKTEQRKKTDAVVVRRRPVTSYLPIMQALLHPLFWHTGLSDC
jgi:hypothetical protein